MSITTARRPTSAYLISGIDGVPDGIRTDEKGNIYVAAKGVSIYRPDGKLLHHHSDGGNACQLRLWRCRFPDAVHHRADVGLPGAAGREGRRCSIERHAPMSDVAAIPAARSWASARIILERDRVLLVERGRDPLKGYWSLPGGVLEVGETLEEGMRREVLEETGLEVRAAAAWSKFSSASCCDAAGAAGISLRADRLSVPRRPAARCAPADDVSRAAVGAERELARTTRITEGTLPVIEKAFRERRR